MKDKTHQCLMFFLKDRIGVEEVSIKYCPTLVMWADMFTKPLQRAAFWEMEELL